MNNLSRILLLSFKITLGMIVGLISFEVIIQLNSQLLLPGIPAKAPVDAPLTTLEYDVFYSDADVFTWRSDLIKPIINDELEAQVVYQTDQFGFHNVAPLPSQIDIVALGRSVTQGAQNKNNWPMIINQTNDYTILNLAQPGEMMENRFAYLEMYGLPRNPKWVIIEVIPAIDIHNFQQNTQPFLSPRLFSPIIRDLVLKFGGTQNQEASNPIYPIATEINGKPIDITCCIHYSDVYTLDPESIQESRPWISYKNKLLDEINELKNKGYCVVLLFAPQKMDVYFPIIDHEALAIIASQTHSLMLNATGTQFVSTNKTPTAEILKKNASAMRDTLETFTSKNDIYWIDPTSKFIENSEAGVLPFMVYDSHWNQLGHQIVADLTLELLNKEQCP